MKFSAAGGRGTRGADFFERRDGVAPPHVAKKVFTSFTDSCNFYAARIFAMALRASLSLSSTNTALLFCSMRFSVFPQKFYRVYVNGCELRVRRASIDTVVVRLAALRLASRAQLRWPLAVAINTRRASAPVDFGQSFAGESVRLRGTVVAGGEREAATARARRAVERTLRSGWVGFKAAEG